MCIAIPPTTPRWSHAPVKPYAARVYDEMGTWEKLKFRARHAGGGGKDRYFPGRSRIQERQVRRSDGATTRNRTRSRKLTDYCSPSSRSKVSMMWLRLLISSTRPL